jgi:hypothetical protein
LTQDAINQKPVFSWNPLCPTPTTVISLTASRQEYSSVFSGYNYMLTSIGADIYQTNRQTLYSYHLRRFSRSDYLGTFTGTSLNRSMTIITQDYLLKRE